MKTRFIIVVVLFFAVLQFACSGESKKESDVKGGPKSLKESKADTSAEAKLAKRARDLQDQADHLGLIYCKCTERRADSTRRTCIERIEKAVTAISTNLKGEEKAAFDAKYSEKTTACKVKKADKAEKTESGK